MTRVSIRALSSHLYLLQVQHLAAAVRADALGDEADGAEAEGEGAARAQEEGR